MTTEKKVVFLTLSQKISDLNTLLLDATGTVNDEAEGDAADELLQASQKLIQAQNNIMKAVSK